MSTEQKVIVTVAAVVVIVLVLVCVVPGPTANATAIVRGAPPATPASGDHVATLDSDRELFAHDADAQAYEQPTRKLPRGQRVKIVETLGATRMGRRLYRVATMTGPLVDTGSNSRGYLYLGAAEVA